MVEALRRFLRVVPRLWTSLWLWVLEELRNEELRLREDGRVEEVSGYGKSGCLKGYGGGWKDRCEYRGGGCK